MEGSILGNFAQALIRYGLLDEYRLWVFPLVLGSGKRLFADGTIPAALRLVDDVVDALATQRRATWELFWTERTKSA